MPTLLECLLELEELKRRTARSSGWGSDGDYDRNEQEEFERSLGAAMVAVADDLVKSLGDLRIPFNAKLPTLRERSLYEQNLSGPKAVRAIQDALSEVYNRGATTIAVADETGISFMSRIDWSALRGKGAIVLVAPNEAVAAMTRHDLRHHGGDATIEVTTLRDAAGMFPVGGLDLGIVCFLERHAGQDAAAAKIVEDVRRASPEVLVVYETGHPAKRRIAQTDATLRRTSGDTVRIEDTELPIRSLGL